MLIELLKLNERLGFYKSGRSNGQIDPQKTRDAGQELLDKLKRLAGDEGRETSIQHPAS